MILDIAKRQEWGEMSSVDCHVEQKYSAINSKIMKSERKKKRYIMKQPELEYLKDCLCVINFRMLGGLFETARRYLTKLGL